MNYYAEALALEAAASATSGSLTGLAENRVAFVAREDVAAAAAGILLTDGHAGAIYNATGPAAYTGAERAALASELLGTPIGFVVVALETLRSGMARMGLPDPVINTVSDIQQVFADGAFNVVTGDVEKLAGRPPKNLRDALAASLS